MEINNNLREAIETVNNNSTYDVIQPKKGGTLNAKIREHKLELDTMKNVVCGWIREQMKTIGRITLFEPIKVLDLYIVEILQNGKVVYRDIHGITYEYFVKELDFFDTNIIARLEDALYYELYERNTDGSADKLGIAGTVELRTQSLPDWLTEDDTIGKIQSMNEAEQIYFDSMEQRYKSKGFDLSTNEDNLTVVTTFVDGMIIDCSAPLTTDRFNKHRDRSGSMSNTYTNEITDEDKTTDDGVKDYGVLLNIPTTNNNDDFSFSLDTPNKEQNYK